MKRWRWRMVAAISLLTTIAAETGVAQEQWGACSDGILTKNITKVAYLSPGSTQVFVGTDRGLYVSANGTCNFERVELFSGTPVYVQDMDAAVSSGSILLATKDGIFVGQKDGESWRHVFNGKGEGSRDCLSVLATDTAWYAGTANGLFRAEPGGDNWERWSGEMGRMPLIHLAEHQGHFFAATPHHLYQFDPDLRQQRKILSLGISTNDSEDAENAASVYGDAEIRDLHVIPGGILPQFPVDTLLVVSEHQILAVPVEPDGGSVEWQPVWPDGAYPHGMQSIAVDRHERLEDPFVGPDMTSREHVFQQAEVFLGTGQGVFQYQQGGWQLLYEGASVAQVRDLAVSAAGDLWAGTAQGLFVYRVPPDSVSYAVPDATRVNRVSSRLQELFSQEPTIRDVQEMAIAYADVHPDKIKRWKSQSRWRALVPSVSAGIDRSATDLYHWDTGSKPDELLKGREYTDWDVSVSWDFADIVWNSGLTSIDSRSKLMVELREDILDQVTRLYFERRRLALKVYQLERQQIAPKEEDVVNLQLRMAEVTALIDGLTGGRFGQRLPDGSL